jgi:hypothetical protein
MEASGKIGSNGVYVSDNVEERFETDIRTYIHFPVHKISPTSNSSFCAFVLMDIHKPKFHSKLNSTT